MKSVSSVVEELIKQKPYIEEALSQDLINKYLEYDGTEEL